MKLNSSKLVKNVGTVAVLMCAEEEGKSVGEVGGELLFNQTSREAQSFWGVRKLLVVMGGVNLQFCASHGPPLLARIPPASSEWRRCGTCMSSQVPANADRLQALIQERRPKKQPTKALEIAGLLSRDGRSMSANVKPALSRGKASHQWPWRSLNW